MSYGIKEKVLICPLIGLYAKVVRSSSKEMEGFEGKVIDETKNMLVFESENDLNRNRFKYLKNQNFSNEIKKISKKGKIIEVSFEGEKIAVNGDEIMFRPEEKAKNIKI
ncbi:MAG: ribonuclease P protein subunit [Candidatus ainarchaeum sp.]|nr:ribonuclease P protein subunit [Candidatus ainarchaeum sp.]